MAIIAVDPSLSATGVAMLSPGPTWSVGTIKPPVTTNPDLAVAANKRMNDIMWALAFWQTEHAQPTHGHGRVDLAVIEAPAYSRGMGMAHERAGLWWRLYSMLHEQSIPVLVVLPNLRAKYATGKGNAGKDQVLLAASRRYPGVPMTNNNEADAVVLAAMGARWAGHPIDSLPKAHVDAMKTLAS